MQVCLPIQSGGRKVQSASVVRCDGPSVPASLLEAYHGGHQEDDRDVDFSGGDDVVYDNAVDLPYMADMFHDPLPVSKSGHLMKFSWK